MIIPSSVYLNEFRVKRKIFDTVELFKQTNNFTRIFFCKDCICKDPPFPKHENRLERAAEDDNRKTLRR